MVKSKPRTAKKKIEIKRIDDTAARDVCFSKRRRGLINKAGELSLLCDANIATIVISRGGKGFSFGHPSVDDVANRLASMAMGTSNNPSLGGGSHNSGEVTDILQRQLKHEHVELQKSLETEEERKQTMEKEKMEKETLEKEMGGHLMDWLNSEANLLGLDELEELQYKLSVVHVSVNARMYQKLQEPREARMPLPQPHMEMALPSQFLQGQAVVPTSAPLLGSNYGLVDEIDANHILSSVQDSHGSRGFQNGEIGG